MSSSYHGGKEWHTYDEIAYLTNIGSYTQTPNPDKRSLLRSYLKACELRVNWGKVDKAAVIAHAKKMLGE